MILSLRKMRVFDKLVITEIFCDSRCSESEDVKKLLLLPSLIYSGLYRKNLTGTACIEP